MAKRGLSTYAFCADAGMFLYSGMLYTILNGVHTDQCDFHEDRNNDHISLDGVNKNISSNQMVNMIFPNCSNPDFGRCAMNQFTKEYNGNVDNTMELA